ncbi:hypothetical protein [Agrobacterium sp.]|uniref:hypothetical protein n=1 Tax=Agrobacterium sp. TaxID=361 RepID=UPI0028B1920D|nr:hypothetical protein [Agrobacterium sp.]
MPNSRRTTLRVLDNAEVELVEASRHPAINTLADSELQQLRKTLRERRDKARDLANRTRREIRGKSARADGKAASTDTGIRERLSILANAVQRSNQEHSRRKRFSSRDVLKRNAEKALEMRRAAASPINRPSSRRADKGMNAIPNERAEDLVNRMELGRVSQFVRDSQAKRDRRHEEAGV